MKQKFILLPVLLGDHPEFDSYYFLSDKITLHKRTSKNVLTLKLFVFKGNVESVILGTDIKLPKFLGQDKALGRSRSAKQVLSDIVSIWADKSH